MRFLHTADWQMGMRAPHGAEQKAEDFNRARMEAAERVLDAAKRHQVDFLLLAGDTFENNAVSRPLVRRVAELLGRAPCPVFVLPGNHDPLVPGSVWEHPVWEEYPNLFVLRRAEPIEVPGGLLLACPVTSPHSRRDPTAWIQVQAEERICVVAAHGNLQEVSPDGELPLSKQAPSATGADYIALGHWHSVHKVRGLDGMVRMAYSGTHEPTRFEEPNSGKALVVEIPARRAPPSLEEVETGRLSWHALDRQVLERTDLEALRRDLEAIPNPKDSLVRARLRGVYPPDAEDILSELEVILESRFLLGYLDTKDLNQLPQDDSWLERITDPLGRALAEELLAQPDTQARVLALRELLDILRQVVP